MIRTPASSCFRRFVRSSNNYQRITRRRRRVDNGSNSSSNNNSNSNNKNIYESIREDHDDLPGVLRETQAFEISRLAEKTGVRLTAPEVLLLRKKLGCRGDGVASFNEFKRIGKEAQEKQWARELLLSAVEQPITKMDKLGSKIIMSLDFVGKGLFAVVGAQVAGDAGMNIVGCTLVGCVACMGGGTLNNLLYGLSTLEAQTGVRWVIHPSILYTAIACSMITFFVWPVYCREQAKIELKAVFGRELHGDGSADKDAFIHACKRDQTFREGIAKGLGREGKKFRNNPEKLFELADSDGSGHLELDEMCVLVGKRFSGSDVIYALDTIAFASLSVFGVHQATTRGVNPIVACTSGITICFGGIMRDVLCGKDIAVGGQSYAAATAMGSTVFVGLRELGIRGIPIPLVARIILSFFTTVGIRSYEYIKGAPLMRSMHYHESPKRFPHKEEDDEKPKDAITTFVRHVTG